MGDLRALVDIIFTWARSLGEWAKVMGLTGWNFDSRLRIKVMAL